MKVYYIDLDWAGSLSEASSYASEYNLVIRRLPPYMYVTGWPLIRFTGKLEDLRKFIREVYMPDLNDKQYKEYEKEYIKEAE